MGRGRFSEDSKRYWYLDPTNTRICFIVSPQKCHPDSENVCDEELSLLNRSFSKHHEKCCNVLNVLNRFFKNVLKYGASSKKLKHFHILPLLFGHSDTKICSLRSHITGTFHMFSSRAPVIHDDKLARRSNSMTHSFISCNLVNDPSCLSRKGVLVPEGS